MTALILIYEYVLYKIGRGKRKSSDLIYQLKSLFLGTIFIYMEYRQSIRKVNI